MSARDVGTVQTRNRVPANLGSLFFVVNYFVANIQQPVVHSSVVLKSYVQNNSYCR